MEATATLRGIVTLDDRMSGPLRRLHGVIGGLQGGLGKIASGIGTGLRNAAIIGGAGLAILTSQIKEGLDSLIRLDSLQRQTAAVIKSTGDVSGQSAGSVRALAESLENLTTVDDKQIQSAENMLLTFTNIRGTIFPEATKATIDLAVAMAELHGTEVDLSEASIQIGKALQDPIAGVTALRRVGVVLSDQQQEQIKSFIKQGDLMSAQRVILKELATEFGGAGGAYGKGTAASIRRVQDAIEDAQRALATAFLPVIERVSARLQEFLKRPDVLRGIEDFGKKLASLFSDANLDKGSRFVQNIWERLERVDWNAIKGGFEAVASLAGKVVDAFLKLPPAAQEAILAGLVVNKLTGGQVAGGVGQIAGTAVGAAGTLFNQFLGRGSSPANPVFVSGIGGVGGAGAGGLSLLGGIVGGLAIGTAAGGAVLTAQDIQAGTEEGTKRAFVTLSTGPGGLISRGLEPLLMQFFGADSPLFKTLPELLNPPKTQEETVDKLAELNRKAVIQAETLQSIRDNSRGIGEQAEELRRIRQLQQTYLAQIAAKPAASTTIYNRIVVDGRLVAYSVSQINATGTYSTRQTYAI